MKRATRLIPLVAVAALAIALLLPASAFGAQSIGISAPKFEFNVSAGQSEKGEILLSNAGTQDAQVLIYSADQSVDASGVPHYTTPDTENGSLGQGPASWVQLTLPKGIKTIGNTPYVELKPGEEIPVKFNFTVPKGTGPGDHQAVIFFQMFEMSSNQQGAVTRVSGRIGSRLRIRINGAFVEKLDVAPFAVRNFVIGDKIPWSFTIANAGNLDEHPTIDLQVLDSSEAEVARSRVMTEGAVYAGTKMKLSGALVPEKAGLGNYLVRLTASYKKQDASQPETITKDRTVFVIPLWLVYAAIAVLAAILIAIVVLFTRGRARRRSAATPVAQVQSAAEPAQAEEQRMAE